MSSTRASSLASSAAEEDQKIKKIKKSNEEAAYAHSLPSSFAIRGNDGMKESSEMQPQLLTVHVGVQPEDAEVEVSKGTAQPAAALLPPLFLQPLTVRDARLLVHLEAPDKHNTSVRAVKSFALGISANSTLRARSQLSKF